MRGCPHLGSLCSIKKFEPIIAGKIGNRYYFAFLPQEVAGKLRNVAHVDPTTNDSTAFSDAAQCLRHEGTRRRENDRCVKHYGRHVTRTAGPFRTQRQGKVLRLAVTCPRKGVNIATLPATDLRKDVRRCTKAVKTDSFSVACQTE